MAWYQSIAWGSCPCNLYNSSYIPHAVNKLLQRVWKGMKTLDMVIQMVWQKMPITVQMTAEISEITDIICFSAVCFPVTWLISSKYC